MKKIEDAKKEYMDIEIPEELVSRVDAAIKMGISNMPKDEEKKMTNNNKKKTVSISKIILSSAAAITICFTLALNSSEAFAKEMENIPVLGGIAKVLTLRSYETVEEDRTIAVEVPEIVVEEESISQIQDGTQKSTEEKAALDKKVMDVNAEIERLVAEYLQDANARTEEYKKAFLETGGTEEEWKEHNTEITVDYQIKCENEEVLSLLLTGSESYSGAYAVQKYYNIDLKTGKEITLADRFGAEYTEKINQEIVTQMQEQMKQDTSVVYWIGAEEMDGFETVTEDTSFYINENNQVVIVFEKYEVAPGAMGSPEFVIK